ncbi:Na+-driven multidrug efflux pump [Clostridium paraputrificum]|uniref:oligosaccharide flippase family protein n=1 Tax=Clostridium paraputrificum TaxID=29363 RepID=UPI0006BEDE19|nr:oligosaccharide flippase family protein [Clostridium paraputrificum]CUQ42710.1 Na+-driven multidrug efflux pump [Clostridium paraputrificum]
MKRDSQLKAGAVLSYVSLGITSLISILYTPVMLRLLGKSEYGLFNLANSVIGYLGVLDFGLSNAVIRYTARYRALDDKEGEENLYGMFIFLYSLLAILIVIVGLGFVATSNAFFGNTLTSVELHKIKILMIIMIFNLAISFPGGVFAGIITAYERFVFPKIMTIVRAILNPFIMLPLLFMGYKSIAITIATTILNIAVILINIYYCFAKLNIKIKLKRINFALLKEVIGYSFFIFLNIIMDKVYWSTDQFILGSVLGTTSVAVYSVASTLNTYYMSFSTAISGVLLPKVTQMVTKNVDDKELSNLFIRIGRIQYIIMTAILGGFLVVGKEFILLWAGKDYGNAFYITLAIMIPLTIPLVQNVGVLILQAKNMNQFRSIILIVIAVVNVVISIPMAKIFGGFGCALASGMCFVIGTGFIMNIYYKRKLGIDIKRFWINIIQLTIPIIISVVSTIIGTSFFDLSSSISIIVKGVIYIILYSSIVVKIGLNKYEKSMILNFLRISKRREGCV